MPTLKEWKRDFNKLPKWEKFSIVTGLIIGVIGLIYGGNYIQNHYQNSVTNSSLTQSPLCVGQNCNQNITYNIKAETNSYTINYHEISNKAPMEGDWKEPVFQEFINRLGCQYTILENSTINFLCNFETRSITNPYDYALNNVLMILPNKEQLLIPKIYPHEEKTYAICLKDYVFCFSSSKFKIIDEQQINPCWEIKIDDWASLKDITGSFDLNKRNC